MTKSNATSVVPSWAALSIVGLIAAYATPASASEAVAPGPLGPTCSMPHDPVAARDALSIRIVQIDAGLMQGRPDGASVGTLRAQSLLTQAAVQKYDAWLAAKTDYDTKRSKAEAALAYLLALTQVESSVDESGRVEFAQLKAGQTAATQKLVEASNASGVELCNASEEFDRHYRVVQALNDPLEGMPLPENPSNDDAAAIATRVECMEAIENPSVGLNFSDCLLPGLQTAQATDVAVPERPLRPRGFTAAFSGSQTDTKMSLQFANEFKLRKPIGGGQRYATWGFSTGVVVDGGAIGDLDDDGKRNDKRFDKDLDRINAKAKLTGSLSLNFYPVERGDEWQARAQKAYDSVYKACLKDRATSVPAASCVGKDLQDWLVATNVDGTYKHKSEVEAYSDLYFGPAEKTMNARWGMLLNGEIARPSFTYKIAGIEDTARRTNWSLGGTIYKRWDLTSAFDLTGVASLSYKKDWRDYFASDVAFDKTQQPVLHKGLVPAIEGRLLFRGWAWIPATAIFPKYTLDTGSDRESVEIPFLFLFGEKLSSAAGVKWTRGWNGEYDDGPARPPTSEISVIYQKTFSINPK